MNIVVIPDGAMIVIPLIEKNGHKYLSPTNFSKENNTDICDGEITFNSLNNKYITGEAPSGVRARLFLFSKVIENADACIIINKTKKPHQKMYNVLNDLILFGTSSCANALSLELKIVYDLDIPKLYLEYPTNLDEIVQLIDKTNEFLKGLKC